MKRRHSVFSCLWLSLIWVAQVVAQQQIIVQDELGQPMIGVHVINGDAAAVTDDSGVVELVLSQALPVSFQYLGYQELSISASDLQQAGYQIYLQPDEEILEEVVIYGRTDAREIDLPYQVTRMKAEEIFSSNAQNTADALSFNPGVYVQKSQLGGGSPVLRGFEANKILLVVDGVRLNNAIYRNGHLQNAITIDPAILDQMEVIFGAGSLLYGSEALGGVVHFRTQNPLLALKEGESKSHRYNAHLRYASADNEKTLHLDHTFATPKWAVLSSASVSDRGDLRTGSRRLEAYPDWGKRPWFVEQVDGQDRVVDNPDENIQVGTGYSQLDLLQKWVYQPSAELKTELNIQYSTSTDIPRYDNLIAWRNGAPRFSEWDYGPQKRLLISPRVQWQADNSLFDKLTLITSFQDLVETRISRNFESPNREIQDESVQVWGATLDFAKEIGQRQKLSYGFDYHINAVNSVATLTDIFSGATIPTVTRYPNGGSTQQNFGLFAQHSLELLASKVVWINGLRYTAQHTFLQYDDDGTVAWPAYFFDGIESSNNALVGISGVNVSLDRWKFKASTGTSFRSPNVDDLAKIRIQGGEITIPNPDLDPESVWNTELTIAYEVPQFSLGVTGYYSRLRDAIIREDFSLPGQENLVFVDGDTLNTVANVNANSGTIRGLTIYGQAQLSSRLKVNGSVSIQDGTAVTAAGNTQPLGHIPPTYGDLALTYAWPRVRVMAQHRFNSWKRIEDYGGSVDNADLAAIDADGNEVGTPAWQVFSLSGQANLTEQLTLNVALNNLLDQHYRPFASGISGAGRHVVLALRLAL